MKNLSKPELNRLVHEASLGDRQAFSKLYEHNFSAQYYRSLSILKNTELAEEAVQSAFVKALEKLPSLGATESFLKWMDRITYHCCMDILRRTKCTAPSPMDDKILKKLEEQQDPDTPLDNVLSTEASKVLLEAVDDLTEVQRTVIVLRYFKELPLSEIADIMDCSVGTVKSRIYYAQRDLRTKLKYKGYTELNTPLGLGTLLTGAARPTDQERSSNPRKKFISRAAFCGGMVACVLFVCLYCLSAPGITQVSVDAPNVYTAGSKTLTVSTRGRTPDSITVVDTHGAKQQAKKLADNIYQFSVSENGIVDLYLEKNGQSLDHERVKIDHIDTTPPELTEYVRRQGHIQVTAYDGLSGVDLDDIKAVTADGERVPVKEVNKKKRTILLPYAGKNIDLTLPDNAGNEIVYTIKPAGDSYIASK